MLRKLGSFTLAATLVTSLAVPAAAAAAPEAATPERATAPLTLPRVAADDFDYGEGSASREYFVRLADAPAALYTGGVRGLEAAAEPQADGTLEYRAESSAAEAYVAHLVDEQVDVLRRAEQAFGRDVTITGSFTVANQGFTLEMTPREAEELGAFDEVTWIQQVPEYELHTDSGPSWVGARGPVWDRPADGGLASGSHLGEGVVVGIIDTGINPSNPAFAAVSADGYEHTNPRGEGDYVGSCDPTNVPGGPGAGVVLTQFGQTQPFGSYYDPTIADLCNDKLIGMWGFAGINGGSPVDHDGHGSHTAGTAAGNFVDDVSAVTPVPVEGNLFDIAGVAPRANVISYAACCTGGGLYSAVDQIVVDGVDVVNYSIGSTSPTPNLLQDPMTWGFLVARHNGIHVANSAGNSGPNNATLGSPSDAPWVTVVASSTHDRLALNTLNVLPTDGFEGGTIDGKGVSGVLAEPTEIVYAGDVGDNALCAPDVWEADTFDGQVVLCDRGVFGRVQKSEVAAAAGAGGFILANDAPNTGSLPGSLNGDAYPIPGLHITYEDGQVLKGWLADIDAADGTPTVTIAGTSFAKDDVYGDVMSIYSSRGPDRNDASNLSPHVTAPGHDILAPYGSGDAVEYQFISGTSMASPHVAGAFALLREAFGDGVSPSMAQSALQLTARTDVRKTDGRTPADWYDMGSGHIDVDAALRTGLLLHQTAQGYIDAFLETRTETLNVASLAQSACVGECSWTRTFVGAPGTDDVTYSVTVDGDVPLEVSPSSFTLSAGETQQLVVAADSEGREAGVDLFGVVELDADDPSVSDAHLPVVVRPADFAGPDRIELASNGYEDAASVRFRASGAPALQARVHGLVPGELTDLEVTQDPTNGDAYDDLDQVEIVDVVVPEGTSRFVSRIGETTAPDLDLFVGRYGDGAGVGPATQLCASTTPTSAENCEITDPEPGTYWVLVQSWEASSPGGADDAELITATVPAAAEGNLEVTAPASVAGGDEFDVELAWSFEPDDKLWFGELVLGSSTDEPTQVVVPIEVTVTPEEPVADAGGPYEAVVGEELTLDGSGSTESVAITSYRWDLSDLGGATDADGETVTVTPDELGDFEVTLSVEDVDGGSDSDTATVTVVEAPTADPSDNPACDAVEPVGFRDRIVAAHAANVGCIAGYGIAQGRAGGLYVPLGDVRRDQMASFLTRTLQVAGVELPAAPTSRFRDVGTGEHALQIRQLADLGITLGRGGGMYAPSAAVSRQEMVTFLVRTLNLVLDEELRPSGSGSFTDISGTHADNIRVAQELRIAEGVSATRFEPLRNVRRDQMGSFLAKTLRVLDAEGIELTPLG